MDHKTPAWIKSAQGFFHGEEERKIRAFVRFAHLFGQLYKRVRLSVSSAALSYYLTMTVFPLLICLYTMLGNSYETAIRIVRLARGIFAPETISLIEEFLNYVASSNSKSMMIAGLFVLISYASAAVRTLQSTVYAMQGGYKFKGVKQYAFSIGFSLVFLAAIYFAVLVMLTGREFIGFFNAVIPFVDISGAWVFIRFIALAGIFFCVVWGIYEAPKRPCDSYTTLPGAIFAAVAMLLVSLVFSLIINQSANYPLVYGSLASLILLMLWLYSSCTVIYCGAAVNIVLRDIAGEDNCKQKDVQ